MVRCLDSEFQEVIQIYDLNASIPNLEEIHQSFEIVVTLSQDSLSLLLCKINGLHLRKVVSADHVHRLLSSGNRVNILLRDLYCENIYPIL